MKRILIVETDPVLRGIYRRKFEMSGFQVEAADEGPKALALISSYRPDLVLMDIMLPGIEGIQVIQAVRGHQDFKSLPIIVLSSFYRPDLAKRAWEAGATKCVSKMDCTPNLVLEIVEQVLSGETTTHPATITPPIRPSISIMPDPQSDSEDTLLLGATATFTAAPRSAPTAPSARLQSYGTVPPFALPPPASDKSSEGVGEIERRRLQSKSIGTIPPFSSAPPSSRPPSPAPPAEPPAPPKPAEPAFVATPGDESDHAEWVGSTTAAFRLEIRHEFFKRVPQMQTDMRDRVGALIKSKNPQDQLQILDHLGASVSSLTGLAGVTGYTRIAHLSGAMEALIKELQRKPKQTTASVLRTIAHAADCLNVLIRDAKQIAQSIPQSILILAVDDEPISRRSISIALSKANLRCLCLEDSRMALKILEDNPFDLIFLDAEMPGMNGFELCAELRKLPTNSTTPVIFVTSLTHFEIRARSSLSGGNDLIAKPFLMLELAVKALTYLLKPRPLQDPKAASAGPPPPP